MSVRIPNQQNDTKNNPFLYTTKQKNIMMMIREYETIFFTKRKSKANKKWWNKNGKNCKFIFWRIVKKKTWKNDENILWKMKILIKKIIMKYFCS